MKQLTIVILLIYGVITAVSAQDEGIRFEKPEWIRVVRKASKEKKLIFVDCYTFWCGPCRELSKNIFPQKVVGDFYNQHFVSVKVDMDKDAMAGVLKKKFTPAAYPTLLFIDAQSGDIVHMVVGGGDAGRILEVGRQALDRDNNLSGLIRQYQAGERGAAFMKDYLKALLAAYQKEEHAAVLDAYLASLPDDRLVEKENWEIFKENVRDPLAPAFRRVMDNREKIYRFEDRAEADKTLGRIIDNGVRSITEPSPYALLTGEKVDEARNQTLVEYLQSVDFGVCPAALAKLFTAEYSRKGDYKAMWNSIQAAYRYNVFRGMEDYSYIWNHIPALAKGADDPEILQSAAALMDRLNREGKPLYYRIALMNGKAALLEKKGDRTGAEEAKALAKKYREEEDQKYREEKSKK